MKRLFYSVMTLLLTVAVFVTVTYSWFTNTEFVEPDLSGFSISAYFGGGSGTPDDPFQIKNERHLYNLAWLQYLGYFNKVGVLDSDGRIDTTSEGATSYLTQYSFELSLDITSNKIEYLPPIGTSEYPFIGTLNGNGHTIMGFTTTNKFSDFGKNHPSSVVESGATGNQKNYEHTEIIGFVGVIGKIETMEDSGKTITPTSDAISVNNLTLKNCTVSTYTPTTLIGSVAGYVNGSISDVGVKDPTLYVYSNQAIKDNPDYAKLGNKTLNLSDYTVAGYAENGYYTATTTNNTTIYNPTTTYSHFNFNSMGDNPDWGGSIDMKSLYTRIGSQLSGHQLTSYITDEIRYYDSNGNRIRTDLEEEDYTAKKAPSSTHYWYEYSNGSGAYLTQNSAPTGDGYDLLTGLYKNIVNVTVTSTVENGMVFSDQTNTNYLQLNSVKAGNNTINFNVTVGNTTSQINHTVWVQPELSYPCSLYTYNLDDGYKYYLNATTSGLSVSTTNTTEWYYDGVLNSYYIEANSFRYYLKFINNQWKVSASFYITDNDGKYLSRSGNSITNTDVNSATSWVIENGVIYDETSTSSKLNYNGTTLTIGNANTTWEIDNNAIHSGTKYIIYDNGWKISNQNSYLINYEGKYLTLNNNGSINNNQTSKVNASVWTFSDTTTYPKGKISTTVNGTTYYLRYYNGSLTTTNQENNATTWSNDGDGVYITNNNNKYYIQYINNSWQTSTRVFLGYYISYNDNYFYNKMVYFKLDNNNRLYYELNGVTTYICVNSNGSFWSGYTFSLGETTTAGNNVLQRTSNTLTSPLRAQVSAGWNTYNRYLFYDSGWNVTSNSTNLTWYENYEMYIPTLEVSNFSFVTYTEKSNPKVSIDNDKAINKIERTSGGQAASKYNYIPLNTNSSDNTVKDSNTGYIISGGHSGTSGAATNVDIRVSGGASVYNTSSMLSDSYSNHKITSVYTYNGSFVQIDDNNNSYQKYAKSKKSLQDTLSYKSGNSYPNETAIGGIHFITSLISTTHLITASSVKINNKDITNYEMPENSIDFNLKSRGYINFFATLYYPGNSTFFSFYNIVRDVSGKKITAINHIKKIYQSTDKSLPYIYEYDSSYNGGIYSNGTNTLPSGYSMVFDTSWIEKPNTNSILDQSYYGNNQGMYSRKLFYFEIPVNEGEYALGSVSGRDGGYLLYLDIGANAEAVDRTTITQKSETKVSDYKYVNGIQLLTTNSTVTGSSISASDSTVAKIESGEFDLIEISISRTDNTITFDATKTVDNDVTDIVLKSNYKGDNVGLSGAELQALVEETTTRKVLKYIDYNRGIDTAYETTIYNDGTNNTSYAVYKLNANLEHVDGPVDYNGMDSNARKEADYGLVEIYTNAGAPASRRVDDWDEIEFNVAEADSDVILNYYFNFPTKDANNVDNITHITENISMVIEKVSGNANITNTISGVPSSYQIVNGHVTLDETGIYDVTSYTLLHVYRLVGNDAVVTFDVTADKQVEITVVTASDSYTFKINGVTVANNAEYSTVVPQA